MLCEKDNIFTKLIYKWHNVTIQDQTIEYEAIDNCTGLRVTGRDKQN